jgi:hypothetical protein
MSKKRCPDYFAAKLKDLRKSPFIQVYIWLEKGMRLDGATLSFFVGKFSKSTFRDQGTIRFH